MQLLARGWAELGGRVGLALTLDRGAVLAPAFRELEVRGVELFPLALPPRAYLAERRAVDAVVARFRPDVVHTHGYRADLMAGSVARRRGCARVSTLHGFTGGDWKNRLYERLQLRALRRYDAVVAVSAPIVERLTTLGFARGQVALIPNAWAPHAAPLPPAQARAALGLPAGGTLLGWVGRLSPEKGADIFLSALAQLARREVHAVLVGEGRERAVLEAEAARLGITDRVHWLGLVPGAGRFVGAFDAFVLSSRTEGTPIALFEAMAAGVPIVATRVGGVPQVVTHEAEALLVPSDDPAALAAALEQSLGDPAASAARVARARARLTMEYALGPWLERHRVLYTSLPGHRGRTT